MPIITKVGNRGWQARGLIFVIYMLLISGGITMIYPFLLMIGGSTKSTVDQKEIRIIPGFLTNDTILYRKHIEALFNEYLVQLRITYDSDLNSFENLEPPEDPNREYVTAWREWLIETEPSPLTFMLGHMHASSTSAVEPIMLREYIEAMALAYGDDMKLVNAELGTFFADWTAVYSSQTIHAFRRQMPANSESAVFTRAFVDAGPDWLKFYVSIPGVFRDQFLKTQYTRDIAFYNQAHDTDYDNYSQVHLSRRFPENATALQQEDWTRFVRDTLNLLWIKADPEALPLFQDYLRAAHIKIENLNELYGTDYSDFSQVPFPDLGTVPPNAVSSDWGAFVQGWNDTTTDTKHQLPIEMAYIDCIDFHWQDHLVQEHGSVEAVNAAMGTNYATVADIRMPQAEAHWFDFQDNKGMLRTEFVLRNYYKVISYMLLNGRALFNTLVYCGLAILTALIFNPLAAYAMSRFQLPTTYTILLFLMLTMAFPPMVTQIPVFLLLRDLGLLNTFAALILPGMANGYSIFILKGFFDSQPRELYESASLDGAGEWTIFWQICMNLSKPVLAYIALMSFTAAYANFMFALLICQDKDMWTLMPMLYQLQQRSHQGVVFASLLVASLPTFLVFLFAQNVIMRGIVVPVEK